MFVNIDKLRDKDLNSTAMQEMDFDFFNREDQIKIAELEIEKKEKRDQADFLLEKVKELELDKTPYPKSVKITLLPLINTFKRNSVLLRDRAQRDEWVQTFKNYAKTRNEEADLLDMQISGIKTRIVNRLENQLGSLKKKQAELWESQGKTKEQFEAEIEAFRKQKELEAKNKRLETAIMRVKRLKTELADIPYKVERLIKKYEKETREFYAQQTKEFEEELARAQEELKNVKL